MIIHPSGSPDAAICFIAEAPTPQDIINQSAFSGHTSRVWTTLCQRAGIIFGMSYRLCAAPCRAPAGFNPNFFEKGKTKAIKKGYSFREGKWVHPSLVNSVDEFRRHLDQLGCNIVVPLGEIGLWVTTGLSSVSKWRGSMLSSSDYGYKRQFKIIPTYSPEELQRKWEWSFIVAQDLRRVNANAGSPSYTSREKTYLTRPSFETTMQTLQALIDRADAMG